MSRRRAARSAPGSKRWASRRSPTDSSAATRPPTRWRSGTTRSATRARRCASRDGSSRCAARGRRSSPTSRTPSGRIQLYFKRDQLGRAVAAGGAARSGRSRRRPGAALPDPHRRDHDLRSTTVELLAKSLRPLPRGKSEKLPDGTHRGARRPDRSGSALPAALRRFRRASGAARRSSVSAPGRSRLLAASSTTAAFSRSRRRCCSRCTAARRPGRSRRIITRSTCRSTCGSPTSSISSG